MTSPADEPAPTTADRAALAIGGALVGVGLVVMGVIETLVGTPNPVPVTEGGEVVAATTLSPELRAATVALGLAVWFGYAVVRFLRTAVGGTDLGGRSSGITTSD